jgi:hypothetical protein
LFLKDKAAVLEQYTTAYTQFLSVQNELLGCILREYSQLREIREELLNEELPNLTYIKANKDAIDAWQIKAQPLLDLVHCSSLFDDMLNAYLPQKEP